MAKRPAPRPDSASVGTLATTAVKSFDSRYLAHAAGNGFIPSEGIFSVASWAAFLGQEVDTVRKWFRKGNVRCRRPGGGKGTAFVSVEDFLEAFPLQQWNDSASPEGGADE